MRQSPEHDCMQDRVHELMLDGQWHNTLELVRWGGIRASARLWELRKAGMIVEKRKIPDSTMYEYRLMQETLPI